jgi:hypothetical protein
MRRRYYSLLVFLIIIVILCSIEPASSIKPHLSDDTWIKDSLYGNQALINGRIWRDLYPAVKEDQFLFSYEFLPGSVTIDGNTYGNLKLRYDIMNDEIITVTGKGIVLQLNKEMVDNFTLTYGFRIYNFSNIVADSLSKVAGYVNILYKGKSSLYIKYFKEISKRGPGKNYENFVQDDRVYINKDGVFYQIRNNRDFKKFVSDKKDEIKVYLKGNRIMISRKFPDTYVPVLEYYDSLK